jgi:mRNA interferase MazF
VITRITITKMEISQYKIVLVNPGNDAGIESKSTAQCVVISPDEINRNLKTVTVAPLTSDSEGYPTRVKVKLNNKFGRVVLDQIMTIEKQRIIKVAGELTGTEIKKIKSVLKETFID